MYKLQIKAYFFFRVNNILIYTEEWKLTIHSSLTTETVQGSTLSLQSVNDIERSNGLSLGVLSVSDSVSDNVLQKGLQDTSDFLIDQSRDTLDTTSSGQSSDSWLGNTLNVVSQDLSVTLSATLSETFSTFSSTGHCNII